MANTLLDIKNLNRDVSHFNRKLIFIELFIFSKIRKVRILSGKAEFKILNFKEIYKHLGLRLAKANLFKFGPSLRRLRSPEGVESQSFAKLGNLLQSLLCETLRNFAKLCETLRNLKTFQAFASLRRLRSRRDKPQYRLRSRRCRGVNEAGREQLSLWLSSSGAKT